MSGFKYKLQMSTIKTKDNQKQDVQLNIQHEPITNKVPIYSTVHTYFKL